MSTQSSMSSTNCKICKKCFFTGTGITMYQVGEFCSPVCFTNYMASTPQNKKKVSFGQDKVYEYAPVESHPPPVAPRRPSSQPAAQLAAQIAAQPAAQLAAQIAAQLVAQIAAQLTAQPFAQPFAQPASQPAAQPFAQPASQPAAQPFAQPASQPAAQPSVIYTITPPVLPDPLHIRPLNSFPTITVSKEHSSPKPQTITPVLGMCTFCETNQILTCQNANGQMFCCSNLLVRYGSGFAHHMSKQNPSYIPGFGTFDSSLRYAVPFINPVWNRN